MNKINFINAATPEQQLCLKRWYYANLILLGLLFISITAISLWQLYSWNEAQTKTHMYKKQASPFIETLEKKRKLQEELNTLSPKTNRIKQSLQQTEQTHSSLQALNKVSNQTEIAAVHLQNGLQELIIHTPDKKAAFTYLQKLKEEIGSKNLHIATFEPANTQEIKTAPSTDLRTGYIISIKQSKKRSPKA